MPTLNWIGKEAVIRYHQNVPMRLLEPAPELSHGEASGNLLVQGDNPFAPGAATHQGMVYAIQHPFPGDLIYPVSGTCWRYEQDRMLEIMNGWCPYKLEDLDDAVKRPEICGLRNGDVRAAVKAIMLARSLEESQKLAQKVMKRGQWSRFYFTKNGKGG